MVEALTGSVKVWQLCVKMSLMGLLGLKCMLKSTGVARLYHVEGV